MRLFPPRHTAESVALELIEGLENGTITLRPDTADVIAEIVRLKAEIDEAFAKLDPSYELPQVITAEQLARAEQHRPGIAYEYLLKRRELRSKLAQLESRLSRAGQRFAAWLALVFLLGATAAGSFGYIYLYRPHLVPVAITMAVGCLTGAVGCLTGFFSRRIRRWLLRTLTGFNVNNFADVTELFQQAAASADLSIPG